MKNTYIQPQTDIFYFTEESLLETVSLPIVGPGGDAGTKSNNYFEDESDAPWYRR